MPLPVKRGARVLSGATVATPPRRPGMTADHFTGGVRWFQAETWAISTTTLVYA